MEGHEETLAAGVTHADVPDVDAVAQAAALKVLDALESRLDAVVGRLLEEKLVELGVHDPSGRLELLEARVASFGGGGQSAGDALALAAYALACVRVLAAGVGRVTGATIPLPEAPSFQAGVGVGGEGAGEPAGGAPFVAGAETVEALAV